MMRLRRVGLPDNKGGTATAPATRAREGVGAGKAVMPRPPHLIPAGQLQSQPASGHSASATPRPVIAPPSPSAQ